MIWCIWSFNQTTLVEEIALTELFCVPSPPSHAAALCIRVFQGAPQMWITSWCCVLTRILSLAQHLLPPPGLCWWEDLPSSIPFLHVSLIFLLPKGKQAVVYRQVLCFGRGCFLKTTCLVAVGITRCAKRLLFLNQLL